MFRSYVLRGLAKYFFPQKSKLTKSAWVGLGHSEFFLFENRPKIALYTSTDILG